MQHFDAHQVAFVDDAEGAKCASCDSEAEAELVCVDCGANLCGDCRRFEGRKTRCTGCLAAWRAAVRQ